MRGRKPKTKIDPDINHMSPKEIEARERNTPVYKSQNFIPPKTLTKAEKEVWEWLVSVFRETKNCMVSDADIHLMELYCRAKAATDEADKALKENPSPYIIVPLGRDKNGELRTTAKANPNIKKRNENAALCLKFLTELGLSPTSRARMGLKGAAADADEELFSDFMRRNDDD